MLIFAHMVNVYCVFLICNEISEHKIMIFKTDRKQCDVRILKTVNVKIIMKTIRINDKLQNGHKFLRLCVLVCFVLSLEHFIIFL